MIKKTLCSCLVCVKERIGVEMPLDCVYKEPIEGEVWEEVEKAEETLNQKYSARRALLADFNYILAEDSTWIGVLGDHENHGISIHIKRTDQGVCVGLYPLHEEDGNAIGVCKADFPEPPEARYLVTDYAARLGWSQDSQVDVLADFINANNLEGKLRVYLDNRADEEEEASE